MEEVVNTLNQNKTGSWIARNRLPLILFLVSLCIFCATSADRLVRQSQGPHFVYLADSFLHGRLDLRVAPPNNNDWIQYKGKTFVSFPPVPAVLMMPFVALFGLATNDVLFTLAFAALNVLLMFLVLQMLVKEGLSSLSQKQNLWLTALFGFGTVHYSCAVLGEVWFTAQIMGVTFTLAYILCATRARRPLWAGVFLALAFDTRVNLALTVVYFLSQLVYPKIDGKIASGSYRALIRKLVVFSLPILLVGVAQMAMNYIRFDDVFEFGHRYLAGPAGNRIKSHGLFAYHYLEWNLRALLLRLPAQIEHFPFIGYNPDGLSIFLTTPVFLRLFWPKQRNWLYPILWLTVVLGLLMPLFYQNSGYVQFGYRFALDVTPYLVMLLSVGKMPINRWTKTLIILGILVNLVGAIVFKRAGPV